MKTIIITKQNGEVAVSESIALAVQLLRNGRYELTIKRSRESTTPQNSLLWMWINAIARQTGDSPKDIYKVLCHELLQREVTVMGRTVTVDGNPKELTKEQMSAFLDKVREYIYDTEGIRLPIPENKRFEEFANRFA